MKFTYEPMEAICPACHGTGVARRTHRCHAYYLNRPDNRCTTIAEHHFVATENYQQRHLWFCGIHGNSFFRQHIGFQKEES